MAHPSASTWSSEDSYVSDIITGAHGDKYQKDLALIIFERATRQGYDFRLGYEMAIADKFDDVALFNRDRNQWILVQTKHADTSKGGRPAPLKYEMLFPVDEGTREKGDFSIFKYLRSYLTVQVNIGEPKRVVLFSNREFLEDSLQQSVEVETRPVDEVLRLDGGRHVGLKVKNPLFKELVDYVNRDFNSLRDSIVKLFKEETVDQVIMNYKTPIASILTKTNTCVLFVETFPAEAAQMIASLSEVMDIPTAQVPLAKCKDLFNGRSRNKTLPLYANEDTVQQFFHDLILSVGQPDDLGDVIDQDMHSWMRTWIRPDFLMRLEDSQLKMSAVSLDSFFNEKQSLVQAGSDKGLCKKFLQLPDGEEFFGSLKSDLKKQIRNLSNCSGDDSSSCYINRQVEYVELSDNPVDNNSDQSPRSSKHPLMRAPRDDSTRNVKTKIRDEQFASELSESFKNQKLMLLTAEPGMGKTTILEFLALAVQQKSTDCVYLFNLSTFNQKLSQLLEMDSFDELVTIFHTVMSDANFSSLQETFKRNNNERKHLLIFDAFDEVSPLNRQKVLNIFTHMVTIPNVKLLVSARRTVQTLIENAFNVKAMSLTPFSDEDQTNFLKRLWNVRGETETDFRQYVAHLFKAFHSDVNRALCEFTGLPLMLKMLADVYATHYKHYLKSETKNLEQMIPQGTFSTINLYEQFVKKCFTNKMMKKFAKNHLDEDEEFDEMLEKFTLEHQLLAIKLLQVKALEIIFDEELYARTLNGFEKRIANGTEKSPLIEAVDAERKFIHLSYAEFLVAKFLMRNIQKYEKEIFGADSGADLFLKYPMIRIFFFTMIEAQQESKHLDILKRHYASNSRIAQWACEVYGHKTVEQLLNTMSNLTITNRLLGVAARHNCYNICIYLFQNHKINVDYKINGETPLYIAAEEGHQNVVKYLLNQSAKVNATEKYGNTPLHIAADKGFTNIVDSLIADSADLNAKTKTGWTPLHFSAQNGHLEVVKALINHSANIEAKTEDNSQVTIKP